MAFLVFGIILFVAIHLLPTFSRQRKLLINRLGHIPYLALFSAISLIAFLLIIYGYKEAERTILWSPFAFGRTLSLAVMPIAFILVAAAYLKTHMRARLKHPMLIGTVLWAIVHLTTNGSIPSAILFGSFLLYAIADIIMAKPRPTLIPSGAPSVIHDVIAVAGGLILYAALLYGHGILFGVNILTTV
ncbi:MAG: NnrU family protein [bacterium]|nr:NnrU family protein [bacterium]